MTVPPPSRERGFALLITVVLVAFLVLILVALATFTRVETQVAGNSQQLAQARQNALFALNLALGELQRTTGPDQRITAPSNLGGSALGATETQPHLTGVWRHDPGSAIDLPTLARSPQLVSWLVSGNENMAENTPNFSPSDMASLPDPSADSNVVWLVNDKTVEFTGTPGPTNPDLRIRLPRQPIRSAQVAGFADQQTVGHYAWWVGDEGIKARINLRDPHVTDAPKRVQSFQTVRPDQITGLDTLSSLINTPLQDNLLSLQQLRFAEPSLPPETARANFHHLTTHSNSLLTDTLNGGLRQDLTHLLARPNNATYASAMNQAFLDLNSSSTWFSATNPNQIIRPGITLPGHFPAIAGPAAGATWEQLRSYARLGLDLPGLDQAAPSITPVTHTADRHGTSPLIIHFKVGVGLSRDQPSPGDTELWMHFRPVIVLANPYNVDFAPGDYHVVFRMGGVFQIRDGDIPDMRHQLGTNASRADIFHSLKFRLVSSGIPAGEAHVFTLDRTAPGPGWDASTDSFAWIDSQTYVMSDDYDSSVSFRYQVPGGPHPSANFDDDDGSPNATRARILTRSGGAFNAMLFTGSPSDATTIHHYLRDGQSADPAFLMNTAQRVGQVVGVVHGGGLIQRFLDVASRQSSTGTSSSPLADTNLRTLFTYTQVGGTSSESRIPIIHNGGNQNASAAIFDATNQASFLNLDAASRRTTWLLNTRTDGNPALYRNVLFHLPRNPESLVSLGQLQHFHAGGYLPLGTNGLTVTYPATGNLSITFENGNFNNPNFADINTNGYVPAYLIGQSRASPYLPRDAVARRYSTEQRIFRDYSYLLNTVLFDRFFFSTVPQSDPLFNPDQDRLFHSRYRPIVSGLPANDYRDTPTAAASRLVVNGGFNINSTSVEAWTAYLAGTLGVPFNAEVDPDDAPFPRSPHQPLGSANADNGFSEQAWAGFRKLTSAEIRTLAERIVDQVKLRGPFLSLSDFVNRRLLPAGSDPDYRGLAGVLEYVLNPPPPLAPTFNAGFNHATLSARQNIPGGGLGTTSDREHIARHYAQGFPGWLSQADLLQPMAATATARSDTFLIRTYGDVQNPTDDPGAPPAARAWCEAIVQRLPAFVDDAQPADTTRFGTPALNAQNQEFGRRFVVVSFRWLTPDDI